MTTKSTLQLDFMTDQNKAVRISIANPKQPVDATAVDSALDLIVAKGIFNFTQGAITEKVGAQLVQTDTTPIG